MFLVLQLYFNFAHNVYCVISYLYVSVRCVIDCNKLLLSIYINVYLKLTELLCSILDKTSSS